MGDKLSILKADRTVRKTPQTILIPLAISLLLYLLISHLLLPFIRRHRQRYAQYLPVPSAPSLPRLQSAVSSLLLPSGWRARRPRRPRASNGGGPARSFFGFAWGRGAGDDDGGSVGSGGSSSLFDDEDGEDMVGFVVDERRREALERRRGDGEAAGRLSRDLEEGFRDDSSSEEGEEEEEGEGGSRVRR
ncbi:hypothetical protein FGG08_003159 [Glutinoglossum americanum]|uniref:Uncharacterized protein n=1 Tax=Glutinoglossum americanum TaxID=1670608 RepID=A0A9P8L3T2_9PEZI|nr:hypothetical protein FGG08_003159 [Glutinoglossum americanum]